MRGEYRQRIVIGAVITLLIVIGAIVATLNRNGTSDKASTNDQAPTPEDWSELAKEIGSELPSGTIIPKKGDEQGLRQLIEKQFGFSLKEIKENPDGTYDVLLEGGAGVHFEPGQMLSKDDQEEYSREFAAVWNEGRPQRPLDDRDRAAIADFRKTISNSGK